MNSIQYPIGLIQWSGAKKGGVREPFNEDSGRPVKQQLQTPLVRRLSSWVRGITSGDSTCPRAVLLVGGPGNGKTDAVEGCIKLFDEELGANKKLVDAFAKYYVGHTDTLPPRVAEVNFFDIAKCPNGITPVIRLVQDATEKDPDKSDKSAETLLFEELKQIIDGDYNGIYLCCVNRGILASTVLEANRVGDKRMINFLDCAVKAASGGPSSPACWPLEGYPIAIWPMDVESLVTPYHSEPETSIAHQILKAALNDEKWQQPCDNKRVCPYCQNKLLLSKPAARDNLIRLLRYFELGSGKRWTFRDLYSLISFLLIGDHSSLIINGKVYEPCEWTAKQLELAKDVNSSSLTAKAPYLLTSRLYHHRLFSNWPRLSSKKHLEAQRAVLEEAHPTMEHREGFELSRRHYRALKSLWNAEENNTISELLKEDFSNLLDPALLHGEQILYTSQNQEWKGEVSAELIEDRFSLSVKHGLELVKGHLCPAERELLQDLAKADESLQEHHYQCKHSKHAKLLQSSIRQFACRFTKRSLGVKHGISKDNQLFFDFARLHDDSSQDRQLKKRVKSLLNDNGKMFKIPLSTTFGQPVAHRERSISLLVKAISPRLNKIIGDQSRPAERLPYLQIQGRDVPLTFSLFKALGEIGDGLAEASLPREVFALIDEVKSVTAGRIARDKNFIDDSVELEVGSKIYVLDIDDDSVTFQEDSDE